MTEPWIDVWDAATFDEELHVILDRHSALVRDYVNREKEIFLAHDLGRSPTPTMLRPKNRHAGEFIRLFEDLIPLMQQRTIHELKALRRDGIHLSTLETLQLRLNDLIADGLIAKDVAAALFAQSPFHSDQLESRTGKFWMVSHPQPINDTGVVSLMMHWGGEVASMWVRDDALLAPIAAIGRARVLEVAVPLAKTRQSYSAGRAILATHASRAHYRRTP
jgi:hypothetical protein